VVLLCYPRQASQLRNRKDVGSHAACGHAAYRLREDRRPNPARGTGGTVDGTSPKSNAAKACLSRPADCKPSAVNADMR
jgi:hypothetical protein